MKADVLNGGGNSGPPTCAFTSPGPGATVSGSISLAATPTDHSGHGIWLVAFRVDSPNAAPNNIIYAPGPFSYSFDTTTLANGSHTFLVRAEDNASQIGPDASVTVTVSN